MKKSIFTLERVVLLVILLNSVTLFLQESGLQSQIISVIDAACTIFFIIEMVVKHFQLGVKGYLYPEDNVSALRRGIRDFIDYYNNRRSHQGIGHKTPAMVYACSA